MADTQVTGSVAVDVVPDATGWARKMRAAILDDAASIGAEFGRLLGESAQRAIGNSISQGVDKSATEAQRRAPAQGAEVGGRFATALKARLDAALRALPEARLTADASAVDREIAQIRARLEQLRQQIPIGIDSGRAAAEIRYLSERLRELSRQRINVDAQVDTARASAELAAFDREISQVDGRKAEVKFDADPGGMAQGRILALVAAIGLVGPALGPIAAVAAGAFAAISLGAAAAAGAVGVLILALAPVIGAFTAYQQQQNRVNTTAAQGQSRALALAGAQDALRSALRGVASAQADAAAAADRANRRVEDSRRSLADAQRRAARDQVAADRSVQAAERSLADAQREATKAQTDLTEARKQYYRDQEDLSSQIANGRLDEREAVLRLADAEEELRKAKADPRVSENDRQRAQLDVEQATQALDDQRRELQRLQEQQAENSRKGVDGSDEVKSAQDRLDEANRRLAESQESLANTIVEANDRRADSVRRVEDAERDLAEAERDRTDQIRRSADSILSAQQAQENAQRGVERAATSAANAGGVAYETFRKKIAALSPEGRDFVKFLSGEMKPELEKLSRVGQSALLPGLTDGMRSLIAIEPDIARVVSAVGTTLGDMARDAGKALQSPFWRDFLRFMADELPPALRAGGAVLGNLARAAAGLLRAFAPVGVVVNAVLVSWSDRFADLATDIDADSPIQRFVRFLLTDGPTVVGAVLDLGKALFQIAVALSPIGVGAATAVSGVAGFIAALPPPVLQGIALGIGAIAASVGLVNAASSLLALGPAGLVAGIIGAIAAAAVIAYREFSPFRDAIDTVWRALVDGFRQVRQIAQPVLAKLATQVRDEVAPALRDFLREATPIVTTIIRDLAPAIGKSLSGSLQTLSGVLTVVTGALRTMTGILSGDLPQAAGGMSTIFTGISRTTLGLVSSFLAPFDGLVPGVTEARRAIERFSDEMSSSGRASTTATRNVGNLGSAADATARAHKRLADEQRKAAEATRKIADDTLAARDAESGYEQAIDDAAQALKENGRTLDVHTQKGRDNRRALDDITSAANRYVQQLADNGASEKEIQKQLATSRQRLIDTAVKFGATRAEAKKYADQVLKVPTKQETKVTTPGAGEAKTAIQGLKKAADDAKTSSGGMGSAFEAMWKRIKEAAKDPIRFVINTVLNDGLLGAWNKIAGWFHVPGGFKVSLPHGFATGGLLRGPGTGTSDDIIARVSNGEYVVRAAAVRRLGVRFLDQVNQADRFDVTGDPGALGFRPRFADGGLVARVKSWLPSVDPLPYVWGGVGPGGYDCSGLAGEVWARLTQHPSFQRYFVTTSDFGALGFRPGTGLFTIGVSPTHMAGNLAGLGFEAESTATGIKIGSSASPPSSFPRQYYLASLGGDAQEASRLGISLTDPIGSVRRLLSAPLRALDDGSAYGRLVGGAPRRAVDAAIGLLAKAAGAILPGFSGGGLINPGVAVYDSGGWLPKGLSTVYNGTGRPEPVLTGQDWDTVTAGRGASISINDLTIQMPTTAGTLDMLSHADRIRAARSIRDEILKLERSTAK